MPKSDDYTSLLPIFEDSLEINNQLPPDEKQRRIDKRTDILATILALYPFTPRKELAREFKLTVHYIHISLWVLRLFFNNIISIISFCYFKF